jgi:hypothetical protein
MTKAEAAKCAAILMAAYPQSQMAPETAQVYESALSKLDAELVSLAIERLILKSKWLPTIAEIMSETQEVRRLASHTTMTDRGYTEAEYTRLFALNHRLLAAEREEYEERRRPKELGNPRDFAALATSIARRIK